MTCWKISEENIIGSGRQELTAEAAGMLFSIVAVSNPAAIKAIALTAARRITRTVPEGQTGICGRCEAKARVNFKETHMQVFTWPGKDVDMYEDFEGWTLHELRDRVELVQEFDKLCDDITSEYFDLCRNYRIAEEEILVPKTIKVLEPVS